ncbi:response regulator [Kribbella sp. CA-294648]|uniref:response regulator n=1 Tax=Kribbella sp. CA-294648 TaxID=3239948 RepID=UPI003D9246AB
MDTNLVTLIIGLVVVFGIVTLLFRVQKLGGRGEATISVAQLFTASVKLEAEKADRAKATEALRKAVEQRGEPAEQVTVPDDNSSSGFARILWVDDHPDNNLFETVALESLGRFVTQATSTEAGLRYLSQLPYALAITDLGRHGDAGAGVDFIRQAKQTDHTLPIIVYTLNAQRVREEVIAAGAAAVVDRPDELLRQVAKQLAANRSVHSGMFLREG